MLTGLIGGGGAILIAGIAWVIASHRHHVSRLVRNSLADELLLTAAIIGMLLAGDLTVATGIGHWVMSALGYLLRLAGPAGLVIAAIITAVAVIRTVVAVIHTGASDSAMKLAFILPFLLALFPGGIFHKISVDLQAPAQALVAWLSVQLGA
jgi:hypothetical protein